MSQLTPQQARGVWAKNIELLIKLAEAYPNSSVYQLALSNCCINASNLITNLQTNY